MPSPSLGCPFSFFVFSTLLLHRQRREAWCVWAGGFGGDQTLRERVGPPSSYCTMRHNHRPTPEAQPDLAAPTNNANELVQIESDRFLSGCNIVAERAKHNTVAAAGRGPLACGGRLTRRREERWQRWAGCRRQCLPS